MSQFYLFLFVLFTVLVALVFSLETTGEEQYLEDGFFGPRLRRVPLAYHENAYLQQLLNNLKPRFRRGM